LQNDIIRAPHRLTRSKVFTTASFALQRPNNAHEINALAIRSAPKQARTISESAKIG
jgi:hypothetical protein